MLRCLSCVLGGLLLANNARAQSILVDDFSIDFSVIGPFEVHDDATGFGSRTVVVDDVDGQSTMNASGGLATYSAGVDPNFLTLFYEHPDPDGVYDLSGESGFEVLLGANTSEGVSITVDFSDNLSNLGSVAVFTDPTDPVAGRVYELPFSSFVPDASSGMVDRSSVRTISINVFAGPGDQIVFDEFTIVPEPSSWAAIVGAGLSLLVIWKRRRAVPQHV